MPKLIFCTTAKSLDSSGDDMSSDDSSSITSIHNNDASANISQEPPKAGGVIVETCLFVGVMCITFFELMSVAYLSLLEYGMDMSEELLIVRMRKRDNSEAV